MGAWIQSRLRERSCTGAEGRSIFGTGRTTMIKLKRAYDESSANDGARFLVERLWPRGISKERAALDGWLKEAAPSTGLRIWYGHDLARWPEFRRRYAAELRSKQEALVPLRAAARRGTVTLVFSTRDAEHSCARVLKDYLER